MESKTDIHVAKLAFFVNFVSCSIAKWKTSPVFGGRVRLVHELYDVIGCVFRRNSTTEPITQTEYLHCSTTCNPVLM